jgi:hypothetical protein
LITKILRWKLSIDYLKDLANKGFKLREKSSFPIEFNRDDSLLYDYIGLFGLNTIFLIKQFMSYNSQKDYNIRLRNNEGELEHLTIEEKQEFFGDQTSYRAFLLNFFDNPKKREAIRKSFSFLDVIIIIAGNLAIEKIKIIKNKLFPTVEKPSSAPEITYQYIPCKKYLVYDGPKICGISNINYKNFKIKKFTLQKPEEKKKYYYKSSSELIDLKNYRTILKLLMENGQPGLETPPTEKKEL